MTLVRGALPWLACLAVVLLAGCFSPLPPAVRYPLVEPVTVAQARAEPEKFQGKLVRWGGSVVRIENGPQDTLLEILSYPLDGDGRPDSDQAAGPRILARKPGFLEPARYAPKRLVTLVGRILGERTQPVGEYSYQYVELEVRAIHLWPLPRPRPPVSPWYDPWYDPWFGPWWRPPLRR